MKQRDSKTAKELEKFYATKDKHKFWWRITRNKVAKEYGISILNKT